MSDKKYAIDTNLMGERIRLLREERQLSREDLARRIGISSRHLAGIETGNKGLSMKVFYHLKKELNSSADYILDGRDTAADDDERKAMLQENIVAYLSACTTKQLEYMETITRSFVFSHIDKEDTE